MKAFNKICDLVNKVYMYLGVVMLVVLSVSCVIQVFTRYFFDNAVPGTEEVSRYCFIWMGFLGAAICVQNWSNAHISVLNDALKGKAKKAHSIFLNIMVLICAAILFYQGVKCVQVTSRQLSSMLRFPMSYVYLAIPVGSFGIMLSALRRVLNTLLGRDEIAGADKDADAEVSG
ncbi:MAG: TRAP transporter small permease [Lachnospiraceae bacterium]|nr:TRAP transporter small permease [Lachnospiraceae bacterium]